MINTKKCLPKNTECLETTTTGCGIYTGNNYPEIGVENGQNLNEVLHTVLSHLNTNQNNLIQVEGIFNTNCESITIPYNLSILDNEYQIYINFSDYIEGNFFVNTKLIQNDNIVFNSSSSEITIQRPLSSLFNNNTVNVEIHINSPEGVIRYSNSTIITNGMEPGEYKMNFVCSTNFSGMINVQTIIQILINKINHLENAINNNT